MVQSVLVFKQEFQTTYHQKFIELEELSSALTAAHNADKGFLKAGIRF